MQRLTAGSFWVLYAAGTLFMLLALRFHYVGEEPIFPICTQEMWQRGAWLKQTLYGVDQFHNPLFNWFIAPLAYVIGWTHVKEAARIITILATAGSGLVLGWLAYRLSADRLFAALAAACYLTFQDVLFYHGWLAYVDPLFAFFIFSAIALLWAAAREQRRGLLILSLLAISCAFLAKAQTAYVFYGTAAFVLLWQRDTRRFLLHPVHIVAFLAALAVPLLWYAAVPAGITQGHKMFGEIVSKLTAGSSSGKFGLGDYLVGRFSYLFETLTELFPAAWVALYLLARKSAGFARAPEYLRTAGWIALLCYLPYWLSPESGIRYLLPIYPLFALLAAGLIWQAGLAWLVRTRRAMFGMLALQLLLFLVAFPYYQQHYRGENYLVAAREIIKIAGDQPLYIDDTTSSGEIVTANLNVLRYPQPPLQVPPVDWREGYLATRKPDGARVVRRFQLAADELYLVCRGAACERSALAADHEAQDHQ